MHRPAEAVASVIGAEHWAVYGVDQGAQVTVLGSNWRSRDGKVLPPGSVFGLEAMADMAREGGGGGGGHGSVTFLTEPGSLGSRTAAPPASVTSPVLSAFSHCSMFRTHGFEFR